MPKTKLYIDGENFLFKVSDILKAHNLIEDKAEITKIDLRYLISKFPGHPKIRDINFYAARLHKYTESEFIEEKSNLLIDSRQQLEEYLTKNQVNFITAGHVRLQDFTPATKKTREQATFREKGVDIRIAVDILADVCDRKVKTVYLLSSDSDMNPVIREARRRRARIIYIGFADSPNKGLTSTCNQTILLTDENILAAYLLANPTTMSPR